MKRSIVAICSALAFMACAGNGGRQAENCCSEDNKLTREQIAERSFDELFEQIDPKDIAEDVFTLVGENFGILTAGAAGDENAMVTSWGGWGIVFGKPGMFHFLRSNRYTLEKMRDQNVYTVTFFDDEFKDDIMPFGMASGRDTDKMAQTRLTPVRTPEGAPAWKEAKLIVECRLAEVTTVAPDDFYNDEDRSFVEEAYAETGDWHKLVLSQITHVWSRK